MKSLAIIAIGVILMMVASLFSYGQGFKNIPTNVLGVFGVMIWIMAFGIYMCRDLDRK